VSEQVSMLIGSFPNANPSSPEMYARILIEEIVAANPSASGLEATCRQIRRTATWLPTVAELLKVLREQMEFWADRLGTTTDDVEYWCEEAAKKIAAFEARSKEAAAVS
jgi:hypothetical protein